MSGMHCGRRRVGCRLVDVQCKQTTIDDGRQTMRGTPVSHKWVYVKHGTTPPNECVITSLSSVYSTVSKWLTIITVLSHTQRPILWSLHSKFMMTNIVPQFGCRYRQKAMCLKINGKHGQTLLVCRKYHLLKLHIC